MGESTMKCPKSGDCQAVLVDDETIHIIPYYEYTEHFSIDVSYLIPSNLLNPNKPALKPRMSLNSLSNKLSNNMALNMQNRNDSNHDDTKQNQMDTINDEDFEVDEEVMINDYDQEMEQLNLDQDGFE